MLARADFTVSIASLGSQFYPLEKW